jgi:hypothetical protein
MRKVIWACLALLGCGSGGAGKADNHDASPTDSSLPFSATDSSQATPDVTLDTPPGYVTVLVPNPDGPCALPTACGGGCHGELGARERMQSISSQQLARIRQL